MAEVMNKERVQKRWLDFRVGEYLKVEKPIAAVTMAIRFGDFRLAKEIGSCIGFNEGTFKLTAIFAIKENRAETNPVAKDWMASEDSITAQYNLTPSDFTEAERLLRVEGREL